MLRPNHRKLAALLLVAAALLALGCQSRSRPAWQAGTDSKAFSGERSERRSLVFDSPQMRELVDDRAAGTPWYASRNDELTTLVMGVQAPTFEQVTTITYDRQSSHRGNVHNHFHHTTYRSRTTGTAR